MQVPALIQKHQQLPQIVILKAVYQFVVLLLSTFSSFSISVMGFSFVFGKFSYYCVVLLNAPLSDKRDKRKRACYGLLFPGNLDPLLLTPGGPVVPFTRSFRRRDNLVVWHELFANLYELKSCIWFWEEYICSEGIYTTFRFDQFL